MSRTNVDYTLVHHAAAEVAAHGDRLLLAATLANFAEVSAECGDLAVSAEFADAAAALLRRHPELASTLTLGLARAGSAGPRGAEHRALLPGTALELERRCAAPTCRAIRG